MGNSQSSFKAVVLSRLLLLAYLFSTLNIDSVNGFIKTLKLVHYSIKQLSAKHKQHAPPEVRNNFRKKSSRNTPKKNTSLLKQMTFNKLPTEDGHSIELAYFYIRDVLKVSQKCLNNIMIKQPWIMYLRVETNLRQTIEVYKSFGFRNYEIRALIESNPCILAINHEWTLPEKLISIQKMFYLSRSGLIELVLKQPFLLTSSIDRNLQIVNFLSDHIGLSINEIKHMIQIVPAISMMNIGKLHAIWDLLLTEYGFSEDEAKRLCTVCPKILTTSFLSQYQERYKFFHEKLLFANYQKDLRYILNQSPMLLAMSVDKHLEIHYNTLSTYISTDPMDLHKMLVLMPSILAYNPMTLQRKLHRLLYMLTGNETSVQDTTQKFHTLSAILNNTTDLMSTNNTSGNTVISDGQIKAKIHETRYVEGFDTLDDYIDFLFRDLISYDTINTDHDRHENTDTDLCDFNDFDTPLKRFMRTKELKSSHHNIDKHFNLDAWNEDSGDEEPIVLIDDTKNTHKHTGKSTSWSTTTTTTTTAPSSSVSSFSESKLTSNKDDVMNDFIHSFNQFNEGKLFINIHNGIPHLVNDTLSSPAYTEYDTDKHTTSTTTSQLPFKSTTTTSSILSPLDMTIHVNLTTGLLDIDIKDDVFTSTEIQDDHTMNESEIECILDDTATTTNIDVDDIIRMDTSHSLSELNQDYSDLIVEDDNMNDFDTSSYHTNTVFKTNNNSGSSSRKDRKDHNGDTIFEDLQYIERHNSDSLYDVTDISSEIIEFSSEDYESPLEERDLVLIDHLFSLDSILQLDVIHPIILQYNCNQSQLTSDIMIQMTKVRQIYNDTVISPSIESSTTATSTSSHITSSLSSGKGGQRKRGRPKKVTTISTSELYVNSSCMEGDNNVTTLIDDFNTGDSGNSYTDTLISSSSILSDTTMSDKVISSSSSTTTTTATSTYDPSWYMSTTDYLTMPMDSYIDQYTQSDILSMRHIFKTMTSLNLTYEKSVHAIRTFSSLLVYSTMRNIRLLWTLSLSIGLNKAELSKIVSIYPRIFSLSIEGKLSKILNRLTLFALEYLHYHPTPEYTDYDMNTSDDSTFNLSSVAPSNTIDSMTHIGRSSSSSSSSSSARSDMNSDYDDEDVRSKVQDSLSTRRHHIIRKMIRTLVLKYPLLLGTSIDRIDRRLTELSLFPEIISTMQWTDVINTIRRSDKDHELWQYRVNRERWMKSRMHCDLDTMTSSGCTTLNDVVSVSKKETKKQQIKLGGMYLDRNHLKMKSEKELIRQKRPTSTTIKYANKTIVNNRIVKSVAVTKEESIEEDKSKEIGIDMKLMKTSVKSRKTSKKSTKNTQDISIITAPSLNHNTTSITATTIEDSNIDSIETKSKNEDKDEEDDDDVILDFFKDMDVSLLDLQTSILEEIIYEHQPQHKEQESLVMMDNSSSSSTSSTMSESHITAVMIRNTGTNMNSDTTTTTIKSDMQYENSDNIMHEEGETFMTTYPLEEIIMIPEHDYDDSDMTTLNSDSDENGDNIYEDHYYSNSIINPITTPLIHDIILRRGSSYSTSSTSTSNAGLTLYNQDRSGNSTLGQTSKYPNTLNDPPKYTQLDLLKELKKIKIKKYFTDEDIDIDDEDNKPPYGINKKDGTSNTDNYDLQKFLK